MEIFSHNDMKNMQCMSFTSKGATEILVAGLQDQMFVIDVEKGTITKQVAVLTTSRETFTK